MVSKLSLVRGKFYITQMINHATKILNCTILTV